MPDFTMIMRDRGYTPQSVQKAQRDVIGATFVKEMLGVKLHAEVIASGTAQIFHLNDSVTVHSYYLPVDSPDWLKVETKVLHAALALALYGV